MKESQQAAYSKVATVGLYPGSAGQGGMSWELRVTPAQAVPWPTKAQFPSTTEPGAGNRVHQHSLMDHVQGPSIEPPQKTEQKQAKYNRHSRPTQERSKTGDKHTYSTV